MLREWKRKGGGGVEEMKRFRCRCRAKREDEVKWKRERPGFELAFERARGRG